MCKKNTFLSFVSLNLSINKANTYDTNIVANIRIIYLGVKFNEEYLDYFKDIACEKNCKLYRMEMNYSEYALKAKEINL